MDFSYIMLYFLLNDLKSEISSRRPFDDVMCTRTPAFRQEWHGEA